MRAVLSRRRFQDISEPLPRGNIYSLERHHNGPHVWVGGHLSALNSATWDPVFFMHHAYIDAVWARFRQLQIQSGILTLKQITHQLHNVDIVVMT